MTAGNTHPYLIEPDHERVYQLLCDCPRGTTPAWATKASWTEAKMRHFINKLQEHGLAEVTRVGNVRFFKRIRRTATHCDTVRDTVTPYLGSKSDSDKVPRYVGTKSGREKIPPTSEQSRLIDAMKAGLSERFDSFEPSSLDHDASTIAAKKILAIVPVDRAEQLLLQAARIYTPDKAGGTLPYSLGHPFFQKYAINEWRRIERELEQGQLSMLFLERGSSGDETRPEPPPAKELAEQLRKHTESLGAPALDERSKRILAGGGPTYDWDAHFAERDRKAGRE